jgi:hypothetical protein
MQVESSYALIPLSRNTYPLAPAKEAFVVNLTSQERSQTGLRFLGSKTRETHWSYNPEGQSLHARPLPGTLIDIYV